LYLSKANCEVTFPFNTRTVGSRAGCPSGARPREPNSTGAGLSFPEIALVAKRILIADDHKSALRAVRAMLESHPGWEVCGDAVTGREAVGKAVALNPDLIVLDFAMPEWNGLKAAEQISKVLPEAKIVLHTIYGSAVDLEAKKHGICRVVEKAKTGALVSTVDELIGADRS
jgi:CheY-like chemotaxis protein